MYKEGLFMSRQSSNQKETVERTTEVQVQKPGCTLSPLNGCLITFLLIMLCAIAGEELKRSKIRLEMDTIKLERMKKDTMSSHVQDGTLVNGPDTLRFDTLKIGKYQKTYVPLVRQIQKGR